MRSTPRVPLVYSAARLPPARPVWSTSRVPLVYSAARLPPASPARPSRLGSRCGADDSRRQVPRKEQGRHLRRSTYLLRVEHPAVPPRCPVALPQCGLARCARVSRRCQGSPWPRVCSGGRSTCKRAALSQQQLPTALRRTQRDRPGCTNRPTEHSQHLRAHCGGTRAAAPTASALRPPPAARRRRCDTP
jgi:hypothetical protein